MNTAREPLAKHVEPRLTDARLARQWANVEGRVDGASAGRFRQLLPWTASFAAAMAMVAVFVLVRHTEAPVAKTIDSAPSMQASLVDGTWLESPSSGPSPAITLRDGSRVELGARSRLQLTHTGPDAVQLELERGRVSVQATHVEGRSFVVLAKGVEVHVVGTRFVVEADGNVRVHVDEGRVRVHDPAASGDGDRFVGAGEEWADSPKGTEPPLAPSVDLDHVDGGTDAKAHGAVRATPHVADAKDLLDSAQRAMAERRNGDAAKLLGSLLRDHKHDPRAPLAAFELGRLRLDALGDPVGAEAALHEAMTLSKDKELRDDAEARRVEALGRMGSQAACERAKADYLAAHPHGVHRAEVSRGCGGK